jgi:hypothetical protein
MQHAARECLKLLICGVVITIASIWIEIIKSIIKKDDLDTLQNYDINPSLLKSGLRVACLLVYLPLIFLFHICRLILQACFVFLLCFGKC